MLNAKQKQLSASNALKILLNLPGTFSLRATDTALYPIQLTLDKLASSTEEIYKARPEIASLELGLKALDQEKKTVTSGLWAPTLAVNTYTSYFGDVVSPLYPTSAISASLLWDINLGRALKGGQVEQYNANIALQKNQIQQAKTIISNEIELAKRQKQLAKESAAIALEGSQLAQKALDQTQSQATTRNGYPTRDTTSTGAIHQASSRLPQSSSQSQQSRICMVCGEWWCVVRKYIHRYGNRISDIRLISSHCILSGNQKNAWPTIFHCSINFSSNTIVPLCGSQIMFTHTTFLNYLADLFC